MTPMQLFSLFSANATHPDDSDSYSLSTTKGIELLILASIIAVGGTVGIIWGWYHMCCRKKNQDEDQLSTPMLNSAAP